MTANLGDEDTVPPEDDLLELVVARLRICGLAMQAEAQDGTVTVPLSELQEIYESLQAASLGFEHLLAQWEDYDPRPITGLN